MVIVVFARCPPPASTVTLYLPAGGAGKDHVPFASALPSATVLPSSMVTTIFESAAGVSSSKNASTATRSPFSFASTPIPWANAADGRTSRKTVATSMRELMAAPPG